MQADGRCHCSCMNPLPQEHALGLTVCVLVGGCTNVTEPNVHAPLLQDTLRSGRTWRQPTDVVPSDDSALIKAVLHQWDNNSGHHVGCSCGYPRPGVKSAHPACMSSLIAFYAKRATPALTRINTAKHSDAKTWTNAQLESYFHSVAFGHGTAVLWWSSCRSPCCALACTNAAASLESHWGAQPASLGCSSLASNRTRCNHCLTVILSRLSLVTKQALGVYTVAYRAQQYVEHGM